MAIGRGGRGWSRNSENREGGGKVMGKSLGLLFFQEGEDIVWVVEVFLLGLRKWFR